MIIYSFGMIIFLNFVINTINATIEAITTEKPKGNSGTTTSSKLTVSINSTAAISPAIDSGDPKTLIETLRGPVSSSIKLCVRLPSRAVNFF